MSHVSPPLFIKDPDAVVPKGFDWTRYLTTLGATIATSTYSVDPTGTLTLSGDTIVAGNLKTVVVLSAGTAGMTYTLTNRITTSTGAIDDRSVQVKVEQR